MDFWDLTKLMFRRWYIAVPLLVLTGLASIYTVKTVKPDYKATAYVQLIPPPEASITTNIKTLRNPWLDLGLGSLNTAATYATVDKRFLNQLRSSGLSDNVVITNGYPSPTATVEVIGSSQSIAMTTTDRVVSHFNEEVKALQDAYTVQTPGLILTRRLDTGTNLEETGGKVKRALVAVLGAGVLLMAGVTIASDAVIRRRKRRAADGDELASAGAPSAPAVNKGAAEVPLADTAMLRVSSSSTVVRSSSVATGAGERTVTLRGPNNVVRQRAVPVVGNGNPPRVNGKNGNASGGDPAAASPDVTVVSPGALYGKPEKPGGTEN